MGEERKRIPSSYFQHEFLRRTGIPHIVQPEVVAIIVVAMQPLLGGLPYLTTSLMISSQFVYFFLDDFVLHLSSITPRKIISLLFSLRQINPSFSFGLPKPHGPCSEYLPYPPSILLHASVIIFRTTVSNICHCTYSICNWPGPSLADVRGYHILAIRDTAYS